ncbi:MAG TPA: Rieske 2Fe-2S domain-containing protein, partial [Candidatus Obscuribacterales bacterium]
MNWHEVTSLENLKIKGRKLFRLGPAQIAVFMVGERVYAIDNRCPHEGYPLMQGDIDSARCTLTCHWHNWKFDLQQGDALVGQDAVRTYPTRVVEGKVEIDLRPADPEKLKLERLKALQAAFNERQYGRVARELARMHYQGLDPLDALRAAITWASPLLEFGSTHAHAAMADWLTLANEAETPQQRLIPLLESFDHLALDVLGKGEYPYPQGEKAFSEQALLAAVEAEAEAEAMMLLRGAWAQGLGFAQLLPVLTQAALAHHLDFGHSLIYVQKSAELIETLGKEVEAPLTLSLLRAILQATREDLLPAFKDYAPALEKLQAQGFGPSASPPDFEPLLGTSVKKAFAWVLAQGVEHRPEALFATLLQALAHNLLYFDEGHQWAREVTVDDNVGWLDATHGLTFANAVHTLCR